VRTSDVLSLSLCVCVWCVCDMAEEDVETAASLTTFDRIDLGLTVPHLSAVPPVPRH
jgi:hypothetical protein